MIVRYDSDLIEKLKKVDVRERKSFKEKIAVFSENPSEPELNNHTLQKEWEGHRSIDVTNDWRAVYSEKIEKGEKVAFFIVLGTHKELYRRGV